MYVPLAGLTLAFGALLPPLGKLIIPAVLGLATGLGFLSMQRVGVYESHLSLWQDTYEKRPQSPRAIQNYGLALLQAGFREDAEEIYKKALAFDFKAVAPLDPEISVASYYSGVHLAYGSFLAQANRYDEALSQFQKARALRQDRILYRFNVGNCLALLERYQEAEVEYKAVLEEIPHHQDTIFSYAVLLVHMNRPQEAVSFFRKNIRWVKNPVYLEYKFAWAVAEGNIHIEAAVDILGDLLRRKPHLYEMRYFYGRLLFRLGKVSDSIQEFTTLINQRPDAASALSDRAVAYAAIGELEKSLRDAQSAVRLDPQNQTAAENVTRLTQTIESRKIQGKIK